MADGGDLLLATRFGWKRPSYRAFSIQKLQRQCTWWQCLGRNSLEIPSQSLACGMWLFFLYVLRSSRNRSDPTRDRSKRMKPSRKKTRSNHQIIIWIARDLWRFNEVSLVVLCFERPRKEDPWWSIFAEHVLKVHGLFKDVDGQNSWWFFHAQGMACALVIDLFFFLVSNVKRCLVFCLDLFFFQMVLVTLILSMLPRGSPPSSSYLCFKWGVASLEQQGGWHVIEGLQTSPFYCCKRISIY